MVFVCVVGVEALPNFEGLPFSGVVEQPLLRRLDLDLDFSGGGDISLVVGALVER